MNPITDEFYIYSSGQGAPTRGFVEGFLGVEHPFFANWLLQSGIAYSISNSLNRSGTFIQGADAGSADQYDYNFKVRTQQLMAQAKFMHLYQNKFYPYLLLGLGASFNNSSNYSTSVPPFLTFTRQYADNQSHSLAYRVGLGVDVDIASHLRLGVAYRFTGLGKINLGTATIDHTYVPETLSQSNVYANEAQVQLTYII